MLLGAVLFGICGLTQGGLTPPMTREFAIGMVWLVLIATFAAAVPMSAGQQCA